VKVTSRKWLPIRKGYDSHEVPSEESACSVENGFRFGRVTTSMFILNSFKRLLRRKWLPIRKGYDEALPSGSEFLVSVENGFRFGRVTT